MPSRDWMNPEMTPRKAFWTKGFRRTGPPLIFSSIVFFIVFLHEVCDAVDIVDGKAGDRQRQRRVADDRGEPLYGQPGLRVDPRVDHFDRRGPIPVKSLHQHDVLIPETGPE